MSKRLTNKFWYSEHYLPDHKIDSSRFDCYDKLGQLEDIEDELGIDLITLFEALKNGIYKKGRNNLKGLILYSKMPMFSLYHKTIDNELIEDYGKMWALTREELKDDKSKEDRK